MLHVTQAQEDVTQLQRTVGQGQEALHLGEVDMPGMFDAIKTIFTGKSY